VYEDNGAAQILRPYLERYLTVQEYVGRCLFKFLTTLKIHGTHLPFKWLVYSGFSIIVSYKTVFTILEEFSHNRSS